MAEVVPFKGVLYNVPRIPRASGEDLVAPPYDIITPEYKDTLYKKSPYNIVRVDFGKELPGDNGGNNKYIRARNYLDIWLKEGVLAAEKESGFYSYEISYTINNVVKKLRGFLGLVRLEELGKGNIHPHECTHSKPKKDRLELMRACSANISPIFSLYSSKGKKASAVLAETGANQSPVIEAKDLSGCVHKLRRITDKKMVGTIREEMRDKPVFIADGHHRYETALEYQAEMRSKEGTACCQMPYDYVMMFLANMQEEGLTILPAHRLVKKIPGDVISRLSPFFGIQTIPVDSNIAQYMAGKRHVFGFYKGGEELYILNYKGADLSNMHPVLADLDVSILHELILGRVLKESEIEYEMDIKLCLQFVRQRRFEGVFFLNPTRVEDVEKVALASLRMPPKSTFFYPKLLTGMVLNIFNNSF